MPRKSTYRKRRGYKKSSKRSYRRKTYRRKRRTQGYVKNTFQRVRTTHLSALPKRSFVRQDITVRVFIPIGSQQYNWTLIDANSVVDMFSHIQTYPWNVGQSLSPAAPVHVHGYTTFRNANAYSKWQVHAAKLVVTARPQSLLDTGRAFIMPIDSQTYNTYNTTPSAQGIINAFNQTGSMSWDYSSNYTERNNTRRMYLRTNAIEGLSSAEYNANQDFTGDQNKPNRHNAFLVGFQRDNTGGATTGGMAVTFDLSYWVEYFDLVPNSTDVE